MQTYIRSFALPKRHLLVMMLAASTLARCDCGDDEADFTPSAAIDPVSLSFGDVAVDEQKTLPISFDSNGGAAYRIVATTLDIGGNTDAGSFVVNVSPDLEEGIGNGTTSSVSVTYIPCPPAWDSSGNLRSGFDFSTCPTGLATGDLNVTDNTPEQAVTIPLSGNPVQQPQATVRCPPADQNACGDPNPNLASCLTLDFGTVNATLDEPCDILVEIQNSWRESNGVRVPVGTLRIEDVEIRVREVQEGVTTDGASAGFELLDSNRQPVTISPDSPLMVPIPPGAEEGTTQVWVRYKGTEPGTWRGRSNDGTGLRLTTNDPDQPIVTAPILAVGTAPDITVFPDFFNFEEVAQGATATVTASIRNDGDATLSINGISVSGAEFGWETSRGSTFPITLQALESMTLTISYTPQDAGFDVEFLSIESSDVGESPFQVELRGGATPKIEVNPSDILTFPVADPPEPQTDADVQVCNVGDAELIISQLDLEPIDQEGTALDDFDIVTPTCPSLPCSTNISLCSPDLPGCTNSCTQLTIRYANNDQSSVDEVNLVITSNDPGDTDHRVVLKARDVPCRFPLPRFEIVTDSPCARRPVTVEATTSDPGGRAGQNDTITRYQWKWLFSPRPTPTFMPNEAVRTTFIPEKGGNYVLGLDLQNSCGAVSQSSQVENIQVRDSCE